ncbi:MAG TPA: hypothetical protein VMT10_03445 [Solirubrobacteraceae bacterium]|nr:hypothetical protein [Solirubrobacteraceae bacterium]
MRAAPHTRRLRRIANATVTALVAMGLLLTAAYAATGSLPLRGLLGQGGRPVRAVASDPQGPVRLADTSTVLFDVTRLQPGLVRIAQIRITNAGSTQGTFTFSPSDLQDTTASLPEPFSGVLDLVMQDATNRFRPITLFVGKLRDLTPVDLGVFQPGEARTYRFTVSYPTGRSPAQDNPLQGATASVVFNWDAVLDDPPATTGPVQLGAGAGAAAPAPAATTPQAPAPVVRRPASPATLRLSWRSRKVTEGLTATVVCRLACTGTLSGSVATGAAARGVRLVPVKVRLPRGARRIYRLRFTLKDPAVAAALGTTKRVVARASLSVRTSAGRHRVASTAALRIAR